MPFINSKVSFELYKKEEEELKTKLGKAIELIPGKSESWLMVGFQDKYKLYFKGEASPKIVMVEVSSFGSIAKSACDNLTSEICNIFNEVTGTPKDKIYIIYHEENKWGWNGMNF